jgi:hypothetical protein
LRAVRAIGLLSVLSGYVVRSGFSLAPIFLVLMNGFFGYRLDGYWEQPSRRRSGRKGVLGDKSQIPGALQRLFDSLPAGKSLARCQSVQFSGKVSNVGTLSEKSAPAGKRSAQPVPPEAGEREAAPAGVLAWTTRNSSALSAFFTCSVFGLGGKITLRVRGALVVESRAPRAGAPERWSDSTPRVLSAFS